MWVGEIPEEFRQVSSENQKIGGVVPTTFPDSIQLEAFLGLQDLLNSSNQFPTRHHSKSLNPFCELLK